MKKYFLALGLVAFLMTSCCDKKENKENCEHKDCCKDKKEQCDKHHECGHHEMPGMPGMCPEMMANIDVMINALANWNDLDETQRADLIDMAKKHVEKTAAMKAEMEKNGMKPGCCKEGNPEGCKHEGGCKHGEGHKCEGNHEGCQHQHEGCQHQHEGCQHQQENGEQSEK